MSRGTPTMPFRIPPDLKARAKAKAARRGDNLSDIVRRALEEYAPEGDPETAPLDS